MTRLRPLLILSAFAFACGEEDTGEACAEWFEDADGDGFGSTSLGESCEQPAAAVDNGDDCDDADETVNPGAAELCDGIDTDCDGEDDVGGVTVADDLQAAFDGATDSICLAPGEYTGTFEFTGKVDVVGRDGATLNADGAGTTLRLVGYEGTVSNITVRGGQAIDGEPGGLEVAGGAPHLESLTLRDNHCDADACAGTAAAFSATGATFTDLVVEDNTATSTTSDDGLMLLESWTGSGDGLLIVDNTMTGPSQSGLFHVRESDPGGLTNVVVNGNSLETEGGIGGGLTFADSTITVDNVGISGNTVNGVAGGFLSIIDSSVVTVSHITFINNGASVGAIKFEDADFDGTELFAMPGLSTVNCNGSTGTLAWSMYDIGKFGSCVTNEGGNITEFEAGSYLDSNSPYGLTPLEGAVTLGAGQGGSDIGFEPARFPLIGE